MTGHYQEFVVDRTKNIPASDREMVSTKVTNREIGQKDNARPEEGDGLRRATMQP